MRFQKTILVILFIFSGISFSIAQSNVAIIKGTSKENVDAEIMITEWVNGKAMYSLKYKIAPQHPDFSFAIPVNGSAIYKLFIRLMEPGRRRLEPKKQLTFPIKLVAGQNKYISITPSILDTIGKKGISIKNDLAISSLATVKCEMTRSGYGINLSLARVENGQLEESTAFTSILNKDVKQFSFVLPVKKEGFYYLLSPSWRLRIYLKPSDSLHLKIDSKTSAYAIVNGSEENKKLLNWHTLAFPITRYGYNKNTLADSTPALDKYIASYEKLEPVINDFISQCTTSNARFNRLMELAIETDRQLAPLYFLALKNERYNLSFSYTEMHFRGFQQVPIFYREFLSTNKFTTAELLEIGETKRFMSMYAKLSLAFLPENHGNNLSKADQLKYMMTTINNDTLKAFFLKDQMEDIEINNLSEFRAIFEPLKMYAKPARVKKKFDELYQRFIGDTVWIGKSSYDFSLPDSTGKMVSMKDFKGKVIFIDVWATWCGPCKEQLPYLKEIEEEYKDNSEIVFMGISIDREKDKQKWADFVKKQELVGVQLFDDLGKSFGRKYEIDAIPRFLLIDRQGKLIEVRCPFPDKKEELKAYLDEALGKPKNSVQGIGNAIGAE